VIKPANFSFLNGTEETQMKALVPIKRVIDPYVRIRVKADGSGVETANVKMGMNPFDEIAVEQAIRLKEQNTVTEIIAVSMGDDDAVETLRQALAMGADKAIHIPAAGRIDPLNIAKALKQIADREQPQLIIMGKQAIDGDHNQTGQMLAQLLGWGQAAFASEVLVDNDSLKVTREVDGGLQVLSVKLPAVVTTDLRLNEPRYASLPNIMKAKSKPLDTVTLDDLGITLREHTQLLSVAYPPERQAGVLLDNADDLVTKLVMEEKVIQ
jgi:electron transfer flavoprotein beta subunit